MLENRLVTLAVIVTAIARHPRKFHLDLRQQVREHLPVAVVVRRHRRGVNLSGRLINSDVQRAPRAPACPFMLADFPFAFAVDFHARRIHHQMQRRTLGTLGQGDFERAACESVV